MEFNNSFLSDAINAIASLARKPLEDSQEIVTEDFWGTPYYKRNGTLVRLERPEVSLPKSRALNSLDALVAMIRKEGLLLKFPKDCWENECDMHNQKLFVIVDSEREVYCSTSKVDMPDYRSSALYTAKCDIVSSFRPGVMYGHEEFMIALRSQFQPGEDRDYLLELLASVTSEATVRSEDNGLGQQVSVNTGIRNVQMRPVKSIVKLRPYRTFQEVEQPESEFLVRLNAGEDGAISVALHEADGGMWKLDARRKIADYLKQALAVEIESGQVVVTA